MKITTVKKPIPDYHIVGGLELLDQGICKQYALAFDLNEVEHVVLFDMLIGQDINETIDELGISEAEVVEIRQRVAKKMGHDTQHKLMQWVIVNLLSNWVQFMDVNCGIRVQDGVFKRT